jgi:hypothetical protein
VIDCFGDLPIKQIAQTLSAVGFSSPPSWVKPYAVLSNGEKFRCNLARALLRASAQDGMTKGKTGATLSPSPGTPGEGWGEGSGRPGQETLTLPSPGVPGEGEKRRAHLHSRFSTLDMGLNSIFFITPPLGPPVLPFAPAACTHGPNDSTR